MKLFAKILLPCIVVLLLLPFQLCGQSSNIYQWNWKNDGLAFGTSALFWTGSKVLRSTSQVPTPTEIGVLRSEDVSIFDRRAINNYSTKASNHSDFLLFGAIALPFSPYIFRNGRSEGFAIAGMLLQSFFLTDGITNVFKVTTKRYRPFVFNTEVSQAKKLTKNARWSFFSGHVSNVAMLSTFAAKILTDLCPDSKMKTAIWSTALALPALQGYLRYRAGKHYPTDVIAGYLVGGGIGYLVPHLNKKKPHRKSTLSARPLLTGLNVTLTFH